MSWRWSLRYTEIFLPLTLLVALAGLWRGPRIGGLAVVGLMVLSLGVVVPVVAVAVFAFSALTLGSWVLRGDQPHPTDKMLVGFTLFGTVFGLLAHFPINSAGLWDGLIALPVLLGWRNARDFWRSTERWLVAPAATDVGLGLLQAALVAAATLHLLGGLMPEVGHDALAMHLFIPMYLAQHQSWSFDVRTYSWAVMPMLVDWLYSAGYLLAGSHGARLINVGGVLLLAELVYRISRWAGAGQRQAAWAALLFLLTPLVFTESSSLFIEAMWSALMLGGTLALLRMLTNPERVSKELVLGGVLLGGALAAKAVTFTALPVLLLLVLLGAQRWLHAKALPGLGRGLLAFAAIGAVPYLTAWLKTGNPVFPFFNGVFHSPFYPPHNFAPPPMFTRGVQWDTLYRMTFDTSRYLEGTTGAAGFQWLLLVVPGVFIAALARHRRALLLSAITVAWIWLVFRETAYLRYVLPSFALACTLIAILLSTAEAMEPWVSRCTFAVLLVTVALNLLLFDSGTYYGSIDFRVITNLRAREDYVLRKAPLRNAVDLVNALDPRGVPVAFFCNSMAAGLRGNALYPDWYNPRFFSAIMAAPDTDVIGRTLSHYNVEYVLVDAKWADSAIGARVLGATSQVAKVDGISVRRLDGRYRFTRELLPSTDIGKGWRRTPGALLLPEGGVRVNVTSPAYVTVAVRPGRMYRYEAAARCAAGPAKGRLQVNWSDARGHFIHSSIQVFTCKPQTTIYTMDMVAPPGAEYATVYASGQVAAPIVFSSVSFRY